MGCEAETVEIIYLVCNGAGINPPHRDAIEIRHGQERPNVPEGLYVCDKCKTAYRRKKYQERIQNLVVRHDSDEQLDKICRDLSDLLKDFN
jgi:hypothetical protein